MYISANSCDHRQVTPSSSQVYCNLTSPFEFNPSLILFQKREEKRAGKLVTSATAQIARETNRGSKIARRALMNSSSKSRKSESPPLTILYLPKKTGERKMLQNLSLYVCTVSYTNKKSIQTQKVRHLFIIKYFFQ